MRFWRSYGGLITLGWLCAIVFAGALTEASASDSDLEVRVSYVFVAAALVILAVVLYLARRMERQAEEKVRASDGIDLTDIQVLAKSNSRLLEDAIALRCKQTAGDSDGG